MSDPSFPRPVSTGRPTILGALRDRIRTSHYSLRTERAYVLWARRFIRFHARRDPRDMGAVEVAAFLSSLATRRQVAAATQNQALAAILFLYREVLGVDLPWLGEVIRAKRQRRLPTVLTEEEAHRMLVLMEGLHGL